MATKEDKAGHKGSRIAFRAPEFGVLLLAILSLLVLFGPFSGAILALAPALAFLAAFFLFLTPGLLLALPLLPEFPGFLARLPAAFALSVSLFGLAAIPELVLSRGVAFYPLLCGAILALSLGFAVFRLVRGSAPKEEAREHPDEEGGSETDLSTLLLWVPFSLATGALAWISSASFPRPADDAWIYLSRVRDYLELGRLGGGDGFSRLSINGWLPEQGMLSLASGLDPVSLTLNYLAPALVVLSLLSIYALARTLLRNEKAALLVGVLSALFILVGYGSASFESVVAPGGEFVNRITEDKFVARYVFLPVALGLAVLFVRERSRRLLGLFLLVCLSVTVVHPLGLIFIGISVAGFGAVQLATRWRDAGARRGIWGLWLTLLVMTGPPALYLLATNNPLLFRLDAADSETATTLTSTWEYERRLLEIGDGSYVAHPSTLMDPAMLVAYLLGVPFLVWKMRQASDGVAARLLLGVLLFVPLLTFVPYTATPIANVIGPWLLHRLTWPLLLAALLILGWMIWEVARFAGSGLAGFDPTRGVAPFLPLILASVLMINAVPLALTGLSAADDADEAAQDESTCMDPTFRWMQGAFSAPSRVMAPRAESVCVTAYVAAVDVLGVRGGEASSRDRQSLEDFYAAPTLGPDAMQTLDQYDVRYLVLPVNSPLNAQLEHLRGFVRMDNPGERYRVYEISDPRRAFNQGLPIIANGEFNAGEWDAAIEAYTQVLESAENDDRRFLAYLGLGLAYAEQERYAEAVESYETTLQLDPESSVVHSLLANAHIAAGDQDRARAEFERAVELDPRNADLRLRYGRFLAPLDRRASVEQHLAVVETFPKVPEYHIRLGTALMLAGAPEAADEQFERAVSLAPLSARLRTDIGGANLSVGRAEQALPYYESALELDPNSQIYALNLGRVHAQLSTSDGREEHFEEAERLFESVEELGYRPWEEDQREAARIALGDLYLEWDRPEDATAAYERALELNPDSGGAQEKLDSQEQP